MKNEYFTLFHTSSVNTQKQYIFWAIIGSAGVRREDSEDRSEKME